MDLTRLRPVYDYEGPFATVYLEGRSPGEDAAEQMRLRWKALRERLGSQGAGSAPLEAVDAALGSAESGEELTNGRVLVACESGVVLDEPWDAALGAGDQAHWTVVPELGALVREEARSIRVLVAVADQEGAQISQELVARQHTPHHLATDTVEGDADEHVHKPRRQGLANKRIQRRSEQATERNAQDVVAHLRRARAHFRPEVLVLAGAVQARTAIRDALPQELASIAVDAEHGARDTNASDEALVEELHKIADDRSAGDAQSRREQLEAGLQHGQAVQGEEAVVRAAEVGAVDTLLFEHEREASREAFLIKVCAGTSSRFDLVANGTGLPAGVGAILRFPVNG